MILAINNIQMNTYDYVVIGSGFGGSVSALRLAEKGYSVCIIESGKRWRPHDFPRSNWAFWKFLWAPALACYGIQRIQFLNDVLIVAGSGVGGGSLVYANTLLEPPDDFFLDPKWNDLGIDWGTELEPHYATAKHMLGVVTNPKFWPTDHMLKDYAQEIHREEYFKPSQVGVFFGEPGKTVPDPYFDGKGPERTGCSHTGHCMVGCRDGGKNSLDKNYLYLAEKFGVKIIPEYKVVDIIPEESGGYQVFFKRVTGLGFEPKTSARAKGIILAAGVLGTLELLLRCRENGSLPKLSPQLGSTVRTNSEVLAGTTAKRNKDTHSYGVSITSSLFVNQNTHIQLVRYPKGSDLMGMFAGVITDGGGSTPRALKHLGTLLRHPFWFLRTLWPFGWGRKSVILLVMQTLDNHIFIQRKRRWWALFRKGLASNTDGSKIPTYIPEANAAVRGMAERMNGVPQNAITETLLNIPMSAHILGGCVIGKNPETGVIDTHHKVFGYDNMYVVDASSIPANLGVNPSLTITALAERAIQLIPPKNG